MIISGYPGVGKSTLCKSPRSSTKFDYIDLESSYFGRTPDWYKGYGDLAIELSNQDYVVFVSSHRRVVDYIYNNYKGDFYIVVPSLQLKDQWIQRLENRYKKIGSDKNLRSLKRSQEHYDEDVSNLINTYPKIIYQITSLSYNLDEIVNQISDQSSLKFWMI